MMGPKKLSTINQEVRQALSTMGDDPIKWLDDRIREAERKRPPEGTEVLESLRRFLEEIPKKTKRRRKRAVAKR